MSAHCKPVPIPNPATPSGGMSATAIATPGIEAESRRSRETVTTAPASPENTAIPRSSVRLGRVRAGDLGRDLLEREEKRRGRPRGR